jgi:hypothetical protein
VLRIEDYLAYLEEHALWGAVVYVAVKMANKPPSPPRPSTSRPFVGPFLRHAIAACVESAI